MDLQKQIVAIERQRSVATGQKRLEIGAQFAKVNKELQQRIKDLTKEAEGKATEKEYQAKRIVDSARANYEHTPETHYADIPGMFFWPSADASVIDKATDGVVH